MIEKSLGWFRTRFPRGTVDFRQSFVVRVCAEQLDSGQHHIEKAIRQVYSAFERVARLGGFRSRREVVRLLAGFLATPRLFGRSCMDVVFSAESDATEDAIKSFVRVVAYQCALRGLRVLVDVFNEPDLPAMPQRTGALADAGQETVFDEQTLSFKAEIRWCYKRVPIEIEFSHEIDNAFADLVDDRVAAWTILVNQGAYLEDRLIDEPDEEADQGLYIDLPGVGRDWMEWDMTRIDVVEEAVVPLLRMLDVLNAEVASIECVRIG